MALAVVAAVLPRLEADVARRFAGLAVSAIKSEHSAATMIPLPDGITHAAIEGPTLVTISFGTSDPEARSFALFDLCWQAEWSSRQDMWFVLPALPPTHAPFGVDEMRRRGLTLLSQPIPCHTWVCSDAALSAASALLDSSTVGFVDPGAIPDSLMADVLVPDDAPVIAHHWKYSRGDETVHQLRCLIESGLPTACVRRRGHDAASQATPADGGPRGLCAWALTLEDLSIGRLHTLDEFRGRGLAAAVVRSLVAQQLRLKRGLVAAAKATGDAAALTVLAHVRPYCHIVVGNDASEAVMGGRAGFERAGRADWYLFSARASGVEE